MDKYNYKDKEYIKKQRGYFSYSVEELPDLYKETGVILIFKNSLATLAHELKHAKQYQDDSEIKKMSDELYKEIYIYHINEWDAYMYALHYLWVKKMYLEWLRYFIRFLNNAITYNKAKRSFVKKHKQLRHLVR